MTDLTYSLFVDDKILSNLNVINLFPNYNIPGMIIPTSGFPEIKLYLNQPGEESRLLLNNAEEISNFIQANFKPYK